MGRFVENKNFIPDCERRVRLAFDTCGDRVKHNVVKPGTPVLTGYAQRSVHHLVVRNQQLLAGDSSDDNNNPVPAYPPTQDITLIIGSNTEPRPDQWNPAGGGYYMDLEKGYSPKGANMLSNGFNEVAQTVMNDIVDAFK